MSPEIQAAIVGFIAVFLGAMGTLITAIVVMIKKLSETHTKGEQLDLAAREYFQTQYTTLNEEYKTLLKEVNNLKETVTKLTYDLAKEQGDAESLRKRTVSLEDTIASLKAELKQYQTENGQLISENSRLSRDKNTLEQQKERSEKLNKEYLQQIRRQNQEIDTLKEQIKDLDMRLRHYEGLFLELQKSKVVSEDTQKIPDLTEDENTLNIKSDDDTVKITTIKPEQDTNQKDSA